MFFGFQCSIFSFKLQAFPETHKPPSRHTAPASPEEEAPESPSSIWKALSGSLNIGGFQTRALKLSTRTPGAAAPRPAPTSRTGPSKEPGSSRSPGRENERQSSWGRTARTKNGQPDSKALWPEWHSADSANLLSKDGSPAVFAPSCFLQTPFRPKGLLSACKETPRVLPEEKRKTAELLRSSLYRFGSILRLCLRFPGHPGSCGQLPPSHWHGLR